MKYLLFQLKPVIESVYSMDQVPEALKKVGERHGKGKTIVAMEGRGK